MAICVCAQSALIFEGPTGLPSLKNTQVDTCGVAVSDCRLVGGVGNAPGGASSPIHAPVAVLGVIHAADHVGTVSGDPFNTFLEPS